MQQIQTRRSRIHISDGDKEVHASAEKRKVTLWGHEDDDNQPFQLTMDASEARWLAAMLNRLADVSEGKAKEKEAA